MSSFKLKICKFLDKHTKGRRFLRAYLKQYLKVIPEVKRLLKTGSYNQTKSKKVWTMWLQKDIPEICQICLKSIKKHYPDAVIITEENINQYIEIPDIILKKYKGGIIKPAHFSDYIRMCLLDKYGGLWIDSTCFLTQCVPEKILESGFFVLKDNEKSEFSNFFIYSDANHYISKIMKMFLEKYWLQEDEEPYYYFYHLFMKILVKYDPEAKILWDKIPNDLNCNTISLWYKLFKKYDKAVYEKLMQTNYLYKLTYRGVEEKNTDKNNLYNYLKTELLG